MHEFDPNKLPKENEEVHVQENVLVQVEGDNGPRGADTGINLNVMPVPEEEDMNECMWDIIFVFTVIYFLIALKYLR